MTDKKVVEVCVHPWPYPYHAGRFIFCGKCGGELELIGDGRDAADHVAEVDRLTKLVNDFWEHEAVTHRELGEILGSDDSLKQCALRMKARAEAAEQRISELTSANEEKAKKIAEEFLAPLKFSGQAYEIGVAAWVKKVAAILNGGQQ